MVSRGIPYGSPMGGNTHFRDKMVFSEYISSIEHKKKQISILGLIFLANHIYISIMYDVQGLLA